MAEERSSTTRRIDRRTCLAAVGAIGSAALAGCVAGSSEDGGEFEADRTAERDDDGVTAGCPEEELLDESFRLMGRIESTVLGSSEREWRIDMQANETLQVNLYSEKRNANYGIPSIEIVDPDGEAILEKRGQTNNTQAIETDTDGTYTVRVWTRYLTGIYDYMVEIIWFESIDCPNAA